MIAQRKGGGQGGGFNKGGRKGFQGNRLAVGPNLVSIGVRSPSFGVRWGRVHTALKGNDLVGMFWSCWFRSRAIWGKSVTGPLGQSRSEVMKATARRVAAKWDVRKEWATTHWNPHLSHASSALQWTGKQPCSAQQAVDLSRLCLTQQIASHSLCRGTHFLVAYF